MKDLTSYVNEITPLDEPAARQARERENQLTKPPGSLGRLEELAIAVAGMSGKVLPKIERKTIFTFAGDHGVAAQGGGAWAGASRMARGAGVPRLEIRRARR